MKNYSKINKVNGVYPSNIGQAVQLLLYHLPFKQKVDVAIKTENELSNLRYSLGKYIRDEFDLDSNMRLIESCLPFSDNGVINADDASQIIIKELWKQLKIAS